MLNCELTKPPRAHCTCITYNNATAHSRNCQTLGASPAEPGELPLSLEKHQAVTISDIGAACVFPIVMKFAGGNVDEAHAIVREFFNRFALPTAGSHEAFWLAHEINRIVGLDAELAAEVYERAFAHKETSEDTPRSLTVK
jgi:hypothetical protein